MQSPFATIVLIFKHAATAVAGIIAEIVLAAFFIITGFLICFIWWRAG